jgi:hypothetical protein
MNVNMAVLADLVLVIHALVVAFNVGGLAVIWIGAALNWRWIRNFRFRVIHLGSMGVVAAGSLFGMICPLTVLEDALRQAGPPQSGFIQRWVSRLLYYDFPAPVFTTAYVLFALVVLLTFIYIKPERKAAPRPQP